MINKMPVYSQAPVKTYLETGKFKDHTPDPIPAAEVGPMTEELLTLTSGILAEDNGPNDSNKAVGVIEANGFFGPSKIEFESIDRDPAKLQGYGRIGNDEQGATIYARQTPEAMDIVVVGTDEGVDSGVLHLDRVDASKSFMTLSPDSLGFLTAN